jgi:hypothetical protein
MPMDEKERAAIRGGFAAPRFLDGQQQRPNLPSFEPKRKAGWRDPEIYWIHVCEDGRETRHDVEPVDLPTLKVERRLNRRRGEAFEVTETRNVFRNNDGSPVLVRPPGAGWRQCGFDLYFCTWARDAA